MRVSFSVNGHREQIDVEPRRTLADALREDLGLTGTHLGCEQGVCGTCLCDVLEGVPDHRDSYLTPEETDALVAAPDRTTWHGRRDRALLLLGIQTGLRVSELTGLSSQDVHLGAGPHVRCHGKGRKDRATPLTVII